MLMGVGSGRYVISSCVESSGTHSPSQWCTGWGWRLPPWDVVELALYPALPWPSQTQDEKGPKEVTLSIALAPGGTITTALPLLYVP